jgi:hypothetical protein
MVENIGAGKYNVLCNLVREQVDPEGGLGVVLLVLESVSPVEPHANRMCAHIAVQVRDSVKALLPGILMDLAESISKEQALDRLAEAGANEGDLPECN